MRILRFLVLLLVVANLLLFAAGGGLFGGSGSGEPERLANQLNPEKIRILQGGSATAPSAGESPISAVPPGSGPQPESKPETMTAAGSDAACRRYPSLPRDRANRIAEMARARPGPVDAQQKSLEEPTSYWVYIAPQPSRQELDNRIAELKSAGVTDFFVEQKAGPNRLAVSLGLFKTERMALDLRDKLTAKGITGARVAARESPAGRVSLELRGAPSDVDTLLADIDSAFPGLDAQPCANGR